MKRTTIFRGKRTLIAKPNPIDPHLEIKVRDDTPEADVTKIVNALATLSNFFGVKLTMGGGGSGGKPVKRAISISLPPKKAHSKVIRPEIKVPHIPTPTLEIRVGGQQ